MLEEIALKGNFFEIGTPHFLHIRPALVTCRWNKRAWQKWGSLYEQVILVYHPEAIDFMKTEE